MLYSRRQQGDNSKYNDLVGEFRALLPASASATKQHQPAASTSTLSASEPSQLPTYLDALTHHVSRLDKAHAPLVETILALPWATMDDHFVAGYVRFIGALVSARPEWLRSVLEKCVKGFKYREFRSLLWRQAPPGDQRA